MRRQMVTAMYNNVGCWHLSASIVVRMKSSLSLYPHKSPSLPPALLKRKRRHIFFVRISRDFLTCIDKEESSFPAIVEGFSDLV